MAHEFGHALGLPDLYDLKYTGPEDDSAGIGKWGLMGWGAHGWEGDDGPNPLIAWSLKKLGWIGESNGGLARITGDAAGLPVVDYFSGGTIYQIALSAPLDTVMYNSDPDLREHLLVESRSEQRFYGRNAPAHGVLVWHVQSGSNNFDEEQKLVDLVSADGLYADSGYPLGGRADRQFGSDNLDFWSHDQSYNDRHGGNRGDASDPFDGIRLQHLNLETNPSTAPRGRVPSASSGLAIRIHREPDGMQLDVRQPRWAGVIDEPVQWGGPVLVDGDLTVSSHGGLHLHHDTRVLFDGSDRSRSGRDPELSELHIEGDLSLKPNQEGPITFTSLEPSDEWYGIVLAPSVDSEIKLPRGGFVLEDAREGIVLASAPQGSGEDLEIQYGLIDESTLLTTGNSDGQPAPGEAFQLAVTITNWSPVTLKTASVTVRPLSPLVTFEDDALNSARRDPVIGRVPMYPGVGQRVMSPVLRVAEAATEGDTLRFRFVYDGSEVVRDTVTFVTRGVYPSYEAKLTIEGVHEAENSVRLKADTPWQVTAAITGEIDAAELLISHLGTREPIMALPLAVEEPGTAGISEFHR